MKKVKIIVALAIVVALLATPMMMVAAVPSRTTVWDDWGIRPGTLLEALHFTIYDADENYVESGTAMWNPETGQISATPDPNNMSAMAQTPNLPVTIPAHGSIRFRSAADTRGWHVAAGWRIGFVARAARVVQIQTEWRRNTNANPGAIISTNITNQRVFPGILTVSTAGFFSVSLHNLSSTAVVIDRFEARVEQSALALQAWMASRANAWS